MIVDNTVEQTMNRPRTTEENMDISEALFTWQSFWAWHAYLLERRPIFWAYGTPEFCHLSPQPA
jgi:hypothetical protein